MVSRFLQRRWDGAILLVQVHGRFKLEYYRMAREPAANISSVLAHTLL